MHLPDTSKDYSIVLLPDEAVADLAIRLSGDLSQAGTAFNLGRERNFPHVSLYMLRLDGTGLAGVTAALEGVGANRLPVQEAVGYCLNSRYLDVEYARSAGLDGLQAEVIRRCAPFRDGMTAAASFSFGRSEGLGRRNLLEYGYKPVGELFRPHITFTRFNQEPAGLPEGLPPASRFSTGFSTLALCEVDGNGSCLRALRTVGLG